jgi:hypothetical protein
MTASTDAIFEPEKKLSKAEETDLAARTILAAEEKARDEKTERLRKLRLAREAAGNEPDRKSDKKPRSRRMEPA